MNVHVSSITPSGNPFQLKSDFIELSRFEISGSFDSELLPVFRFDLYAFLCADVILFVCGLCAECDDFVSDVQIKII